MVMQAVARHSERHQGLKLDWKTQTLITVGATEALASAFMGLLNRGDEVSSPNPRSHPHRRPCVSFPGFPGKHL